MAVLQPTVIYEFDGYRLDPGRRVLLAKGDGHAVALTSRAFDTLLGLVERRGELLDAASLMRLVWPNVIVEQNNLCQSISALRQALGDRPREPRFILTVPGRGYRFVAEVSVLERGRSPGSSPGRPATPGPDPASAAVLPFVNLTGDPGRESFCDGLTEELMHRLANHNGLPIAARTSAFAYKGASGDIRDIARELNVRAVLEGSVRGTGERLRVAVRLVDANTGLQLWSQHFDRQLGDPLALQEELAMTIGRALQNRAESRADGHQARRAMAPLSLVS